jgi:voltage-gated potassium channel
MLQKVKNHVYDVLVKTADNALVDRVVAVILMLLILINAVAVVLESVDELYRVYGTLFKSLELVSVIIFTIEYLLRLWVAPMNPRFAKPVTGRIRYIFTPMAIIDLLAILPAFLPLLFPFDMRFLRFLRVFRLFRLFKMHRYVESLNSLGYVVRSKREELVIIIIMIAMLLLFSASLMYVVEAEVQPDKFPDIPSAMWWGVATLTTVGYGDVFPITPLGKILAGFIAFLGIGIFALPTGILASGFAEEIRKRRLKNETCACPHCGEDISSIVNKNGS